jgi:hypothetical protein
LVRVLSTLNRGIAEGRFRGRTAKDMAHELLALVHGLASLEVKGALGGASKACRLWKDATSILIVGFGAPPAPTL